ncbi:MAG: hypothetical protein JWR10_4316, partial [Rubritepida sp.]|nr:hypothetical protein [Rubritepida sp.]
VGCSNTPLVPPTRPGDARTNPAVNNECRDKIARQLQRQDRGQLMREDERDSRLGSESGSYGGNIQTDRLGRQFRFDREVQNCVRANTQPAVAPAPAAPPARRAGS